MCFSEMPFHPERLQTTKAFNHASTYYLLFSSPAYTSIWTYHHYNFVHDKVFAGFDNFPGQNIIQCRDGTIKRLDV